MSSRALASAAAFSVKRPPWIFFLPPFAVISTRHFLQFLCHLTPGTSLVKLGSRGLGSLRIPFSTSSARKALAASRAAASAWASEMPGAHEVFYGKDSTRFANHLALWVKFVEVNLPGLLATLPLDIGNPALLRHIDSLKSTWLLPLGKWRGMLLSSHCDWGVSNLFIWRFHLLCCNTHRFEDFHALHGMAAAWGWEPSEPVLIKSPTMTSPNRSGQIPHPRPHLHAIQAADLIVLMLAAQNKAWLSRKMQASPGYATF